MAPLTGPDSHQLWGPTQREGWICTPPSPRASSAAEEARGKLREERGAEWTTPPHLSPHLWILPPSTLHCWPSQSSGCSKTPLNRVCATRTSCVWMESWRRTLTPWPRRKCTGALDTCTLGSGSRLLCCVSLAWEPSLPCALWRMLMVLGTTFLNAGMGRGQANMRGSSDMSPYHFSFKQRENFLYRGIVSVNLNHREYIYKKNEAIINCV